MRGRWITSSTDSWPPGLALALEFEPKRLAVALDLDLALALGSTLEGAFEVALTLELVVGEAELVVEEAFEPALEAAFEPALEAALEPALDEDFEETSEVSSLRG